MKYKQLTDEEKAILGSYERETRAWTNETISRGVSHGRALNAALETPGGAGDILGKLDAGEVVPNSSGLAGSHDLTKEEMAALSLMQKDFLVTYDTTDIRELGAKAAGTTAGL